MVLAATKLLRQKHQAARFQFVLTELDLAITFGQMALATEDHVKAARNHKNAVRAYSAARHFLFKASFSKTMRCEIGQRLVRIRRLLRQIDEGLKHPSFVLRF